MLGIRCLGMWTFAPDSLQGCSVTRHVSCSGRGGCRYRLGRVLLLRRGLGGCCAVRTKPLKRIEVLSFSTI